jgi:hypothetical protein
MKFAAALPRLLLFQILTALLLLAGPAVAQQGAYKIGDIVTTNKFILQNRYLWTNDNGQVFTSTNTWRLSDFAGKIVFIDFFAVW